MPPVRTPGRGALQAQLLLPRLRPAQRGSGCSCRSLDQRQQQQQQQQQQECLPQRAVRWSAWAAGAAVAGTCLAALLAPAAEARVPTERFEQGPGFRLPEPPQLERRREAPKAEPSVREQAAEVQRLTAEAKQATADGDFQRALDAYTRVTRQFPDLAITNYARIGRALLLYQTGAKSQAILELEDLEVSLRGTPEVHAALASLLYVERPTARTFAEEQFDLATEFDGRYSDVAWVAANKGWPPAALQALERFVKLQ